MSCAPSIKLNRTGVGSTRPSMQQETARGFNRSLDGRGKPGHDNTGMSPMSGKAFDR